MKTVLLAIALACSVSGCALTTDSIDVPYQPDPQATATPVPNAASATVSVTSVDGRTTYRDRVSTKKNGSGMEMAAITSSNDVIGAVGDAIKDELSKRGFKIGTGGAQVTVEVLKFYNDYKMGFFAGDAVADVQVDVKVLSPSNAIVYSKVYDASGTEPNVMLANGSNARAALIIAFRNAVMSVVSDPDLQAALLHAQAPGGATS